MNIGTDIGNNDILVKILLANQFKMHVLIVILSIQNYLCNFYRERMFQIINKLKYIGIGIGIGDFHSYQNISYCAYQYISNYNIGKYITYMMLSMI